MATVNDTAGDDFIHVSGDGLVAPSGYNDLPGATNGDDIINTTSGSDIIYAGGGNDTINVTGGSFVSIDGGTGYNTVDFNGSFDMTFTASSLTNIQNLKLTAGTVGDPHDYNFVTNDANVAAGQTLNVDASSLTSSDYFSFDGSAETDGNFGIGGGKGTNIIKTGAGNDVISLSEGAGTVDTGAGNDYVSVTSFPTPLTFTDGSLKGGAGTDTLNAVNVIFAMSHFSAASSGFEQLEHLTSIAGDNNANDFNFSGFRPAETGTSEIFLYGLGGNDTLVAWNYGAYFNGGDGDDKLIGGDGQDYLIGGTGNDVIHGGAGNDVLFAGANGPGTVLDYGTTNQLLGGAGDDYLVSGEGNDLLDGGSGNDWASYELTSSGVVVHLDDRNPQFVGPDAGTDTLISIENLVGSKHDDTLFGDRGNNELDGNDGNDTLFLGEGGNDIAKGGNGDDTIKFGASLTAADQIDGGAGNDVVDLNGDYSAGVVFGAQTMVNVEEIHLAAGHSYSLTTNDATVAAAQTLTVDGHRLGQTDALDFNGSQETNGSFVLLGGAGNDVLVGGAGNDTLTGGLGADRLNGGLGADTFVYAHTDQSTGANYDTITGFDFTADKFDLNFTVNAVDSAVSTGTLSAASFDSDLAASVDGAHLGKHDAVLFTPDSGDLAGKTFLIIDANNEAGYQAGKDIVILLDHAAHSTSIAVTDFI